MSFEESDAKANIGDEFDENGNRAEVLSEDEDLSFQENLAKIKKELTSEQRAALQALEHFSGFIIDNDDVANIIGVIVGLKKITYIGGDSFILNPQLRRSILSLGLVMDSRKDLYTKNHVNVVVAKNSADVKKGLDLIQRQEEFLIKRNIFKKIIDFFRGNNRADSPELKELDRQLGKMLGYPETSIDAFFDDKKADWSQSQPLQAHYIHSKEHYQEEIEAYDLPLAQAIQELMPEVFTKIYGKRLAFANSQREIKK